MSRKKKHEHVNHERWLVSYADFITLLFAFFVVLFAAGQSDSKKQKQLSLSMQQAFTANGIFDAHTKLPPLSENSAGGASGEQVPLAVPLPVSQSETAKAAEHLKAAVGKGAGSAQVAIRATEEGLTISLQEAGFFDSGAAEVRPGVVDLLGRIAAALPDGMVRVEGHTDNVPIHTAQFASNWELSSARASAIARLMLRQANVHADRLSVAGYAEFHPAASNESEVGRAQNRRVDIVVQVSGRRVKAE